MERPAALSGDSEDSEATLGSEHASLLIQELVAGVVIDEKYRVERVIGRGAMGVVVAAMHVELGEPVALKFMATHGAAPSKGMAARFRREAKVSARLRNEHIARVLDVGAWKHGSLYMVMELLEGAEIGALLKEHGAFPIEVAVAYMAQVCEGLAEAHGRGIVHRDLKPANLFVVQRPGGGPLVKILDFGISKWSEVVIGDDALTETGVLLGTPKYMSPEQLFGAASVDARADVWSIGAILFAMLTGRPAFAEANYAQLCADVGSGKKPPPLRELLPSAPAALEAALARAMEFDREDRTPDVAQLAFELLTAVGSPDADATKARLGSMLTAASVATTSTGHFHSAGRGGTFGASNPGVFGSSDGESGPRGAATVNGVAQGAPTTSDGPRANRRPVALWITAAVAVVAVVALVATQRGRREGEAVGAGQSTSPRASDPAAASTLPAASRSAIGEGSAGAVAPASSGTAARPPPASSAAPSVDAPPVPARPATAQATSRVGPAASSASAARSGAPAVSVVAPSTAPRPPPSSTRPADPLTERQ